MTILQLNGIKKEFGAEVLLENIDFRVNAGEKIGFVGANGSGKTTLFKIIAGITPYEDGSIAIPSGTTVGYLEQHPLIDTDESIIEVLTHVFDDVIELEQKLREQEARLTDLAEDSENYQSCMQLYAGRIY